MRLRAILCLLVASVGACGAPPVHVAPPVTVPPPVVAPTPDGPVKVGPIELEITHARTAQTFHVVDQLSAWSPFSHKQYDKWAASHLAIDDAEKAMLASHASLRRSRGWGAIDKAFYVDLGIDEAAERAVKWKLLTPKDADAERTLLDHFAPKLAGLFHEQGRALDAFDKRLRDELPGESDVAFKLATLCDVTEPIHVPVVLVSDPSPTEGGAVYNGGRLVVEVIPGDYDNVPTFMHELFHVVLERARDQIAVAATNCSEPLDPETLHESIAYAFAPGIVHPGEESRDFLKEVVDRQKEEGRTLKEPYVRFQRLGLAVRPFLADALARGSKLSDLLPRACEAWSKVVRGR